MENEYPIFNHLKQCRYGTMLYNIHDIYMGKALELYGEYCQAEIDLFDLYIQPGNIVIDVGANLGCHTVYFARKVGRAGGVLAFEPQRIIYQTLCANMALNQFTNAWCECAALGEQTGNIIVPQLDVHRDINFGSLSLGQFQAGQGEQVPLHVLDRWQLPRCDFIKIDVEGMESAVLGGATRIIKQFKPVMFIENDRREKSKALIEQLLALDYSLYWACLPLYNPNNFFKNPENIYANTVSLNLLCIHNSKPQDTNLPKVINSDQTWDDLLYHKPVGQ